MTRRVKPAAVPSTDPAAPSLPAEPPVDPATLSQRAEPVTPFLPPAPDSLTVLPEPTVDDRAGREPGDFVAGMSPRQIIGGFAVLAGLIILLRRRGRRKG